MHKCSKPDSRKETIVFVSTLINVIIIKYGYTSSENWYWALLITLPLLLITLVDLDQIKANLKDQYSAGQLRFLTEFFRPKRPT